MRGAGVPLSNVFIASAGTTLPCTYPKNISLEDGRWMELFQDHVHCPPFVGLLAVLNLQFVVLECYLSVAAAMSSSKTVISDLLQFLSCRTVIKISNHSTPNCNVTRSLPSVSLLAVNSYQYPSITSSSTLQNPTHEAQLLNRVFKTVGRDPSH